MTEARRRRGAKGRAVAGALAAGLALLALTAALGAASCHGPSPPLHDVSLLPLATVRAAPTLPPRLSWQRGGTAGEVPATQPSRLMVGLSERLAVLTRDGLAWEVEVEAAKGDTLVFVAAAPGAGAAARGVVVGLEDAGDGGDGSKGGGSRGDDGKGHGGAAQQLGRFTVAFGDGWAEQRLPFAAPFRGRLRFTSAGEAPLAWAEPRLERADPAPPRRPNLILVSIDTLRADRLSLYGAERPTSPHLDAFAADALVFDRALSTSTWTLPGHGSLFTGLLPDRHGLLTLNDRLSERALPVAERLRRLGYRTAAFTDGGFLHPRWGLSRGFERWDVTPGQAWQPKDVAVIAEETSRWLSENRFAPFFLFVHTYETHQPYRDRDGFAERFLPAGAPRGDGPNVVDLDPADLSPAELQRIRALYDAGVNRVDHFLGALFEDLARSGRLDDTAVIVTSDHGEELGEHGRFEHGRGRVWDECVHVPMIVRPPGGGADPQGAAPRRFRVPVTSLDVAPTLLAWAGASDPSLPGRSLVDLAAEEDRGGGEAQRTQLERPVLVQGINSLQELHERRYRLDEGERTLVLDRVRGEATAFSRDADPAMRNGRRLRSGEGEPEAGDVALLSRLQVVLAWTAGEGLGVVLPPGARSVRVDEASALRPRGVWDALRFEKWPAQGTATLTPGWPSLLVFDLLPGDRLRRAWLATARGEEEDWRPRPLARLAEPGWNPLRDSPPGVGEIFPAAPRLRAGELVLNEEARQELRALGYLR